MRIPLFIIALFAAFLLSTETLTGKVISVADGDKGLTERGH